ncbi:hypothetical protein FWG86_00500 [Candidatus Saccharibacteria bacterium]|nr:hypothetical protein [Candidatus Saccharibacteria bacterium]
MEVDEGMSGGRRLTLVVFGAIAVGIGMVAVSLAIYYRSGAYLADSSRVGAERQLPVGDDWEFEAVGPLDKDTFSLFIDHFDVNFKAVIRHNFD